MSMEQLSRIARNEGEDILIREVAARELAKRENAIYRFRQMGPLVKAEDYLR